MPKNRRTGKKAAGRIVLYSHDTLGFGHLRRNLMLASRLKAVDPVPEVLLISGTSEAGAFDLPGGVDLVTLPAYAKQSSGRYVPRRLDMDLAELRDLRANIIRAVLKRFWPDLFIADNAPLGAQGELRPALRRMARAGCTQRILGLRDVLDERRTVRNQWLRDRNVETINAYYTDVWVYGDPAIHDPVAEYGLAGAIHADVHHTGYLMRPAPGLLPVPGDPYVLCTVGGGRDGAVLCEAFLATPLPAGIRGVVVTGTQIDESLYDRLAARAARRPDMTLRRFVLDLMPLLAGAERVVAMGGYNTVCELLQLGKPTLIVPRVHPRQEQLVRAERFAALGHLDMLHPDRLSPAALGHWLAAPAPEPQEHQFDTGGLDRMATLAAAALERNRDRRPHAA